MSKFLESNRWKHFLCAIPIGLILTILCVIGVAAGMEFKDKRYSNSWDWVDFGYTILGGAIGLILLALLIWIIL